MFVLPAVAHHGAVKAAQRTGAREELVPAKRFSQPLVDRFTAMG